MRVILVSAVARSAAPRAGEADGASLQSSGRARLAAVMPGATGRPRGGQPCAHRRTERLAAQVGTDSTSSPTIAGDMSRRKVPRGARTLCLLASTAASGPVIHFLGPAAACAPADGERGRGGWPGTPTMPTPISKPAGLSNSHLRRLMQRPEPRQRLASGVSESPRALIMTSSHHLLVIIRIISTSEHYY